MSQVHLISLGPVDEGVLAAIEVCLENSLDLETQRGPAWPEPEFALDRQRGQYSSVPIMQKLVAARPPNVARLLAVTEKDLFIPMLSFIFGQAQLQGSVAIISLARLHQEFYGLPSNPVLFLTRAIKETLHEMGHTFGLIHCLDPLCPMALSTNIRQVDAKTDRYCPGCRTFIRESLKRLA